MNDNEINIAIEHALGWQVVLSSLQSGLDAVKDGVRRPVFSYTADLNAMHEAEKVLRNQFTTTEETYWRHLSHVQPHPIYATARQRAEAFLRTLGKWKD